MMKTIKSIVVDDDDAQLNTMEYFINKIPNIELVKGFTDPIEALTFLKYNQIDLIFLDVILEGTDLDGFDFIQSLPQKDIKIIIISGHSNFAIQGFEYNVVDFLLKPVKLPRLIQAINKVEATISTKPEIIQPEIIDPVKVGLISKEANTALDEISLNYTDERNGTMKVRVKFREILYIGGNGNYTKLFIKIDGQLKEYSKIHSTFKDLVDKLPNDIFIQVHKSYAIGLKHITRWSKAHVYLNVGSKEDRHIPIGETHLEKFEAKVKK